MNHKSQATVGSLRITALSSVLALMLGCQSTPSSEIHSEQAELPSQPSPIEPTSETDGGSKGPVMVGEITDSRLPEISGLAVSTLDKHVLWAINDSGHAPELFSLTDTGELQAVYDIKGENRDWESLSSFKLNGESLLLIADTGDNLAVHSDYRLHIVQEPLPGERSDEALSPIATIPFRYPNGPRNCEAVAVSEADGLIVLITKQQGAREVYTLPLQVETPPDTLVANLQTTLADLPQNMIDVLAGQLADVDFSQVTGLEIDHNGNAFLLTYRGIYRWSKAPDSNWAETFSEAPEKILRHTLRQAEAIAYANPSGELFFTSERLPAPIWRIIP